MMQYLPISVVIPTMNRPNSLKRTIDCLMSHKSVPNQIIIVDQSDEESIRALNKDILMRYDNKITCNYIFQELPSLTKARNEGVNYCHNEILVMSDDDVDVGENTIQKIHQIMSNDNIAMIAGIDENAGIGKSKLGYLFNKKSYKNRYIGHVTLSMFGRFPISMNNEVETQWAMGFFFAVRKSLLSKWQIKWDEKLVSYAYPEDLDFSYSYYKKSKLENKKCVLSNEVKVKHLVSQDYRVPSYKSTLMYVINREYLSYKHFSTPMSRIATRWSNIGDLVIRILRNRAPMDLIKAMYFCERYRKDIKKGNIHSEIYNQK